MVNIDIVINTLLGRLTLDPAGMHCPSWDAFVSNVSLLLHVCLPARTITEKVVNEF